MDPQKLSQLDPKLREAYQRVMGTPMPQPQVPQSRPVSEPKHAITPEPPAQTIPQKKKSSFMPILIGIAALFFVAVYTLFWTKIFSFKLPFLP